MFETSGGPSTASRRNFGPIILAQGVAGRHALIFVIVAIASLGLLVFLNFMQPYLLYGQVPAPHAALGRITSRLSILHEVVVLICVGPFGALSDRVGRRIVFAFGLVVVGLALAICATVSNLAGLTAVRLLYAFGAAATTATLAAVAADYPDDSARGRFLGLLLVTQQLAILFLVANLAANLPRWLVVQGFDRVVAGQITFRAAAVVALASAGLAYVGLRRGAPPGVAPMAGAKDDPRGSNPWARIAAHARAHPRFMVVLLIAFVARGDAAIMTGFLSLWAVRTATAGGVSPAAALAAAGTLLTVVTLSGVATAAVVGWLADRLPRLALLTFALAAAGIGNLALALVHGVDHWPVLAAVGLIAAGETAIIIGGQTVLGEQAPPTLRGAAVGIFGVCGSLGVLTLLFAGGLLFDAVAPQAPFAMLGLVNLLASIPAAVVWLKRDRRDAVASSGHETDL